MRREVYLGAPTNIMEVKEMQSRGCFDAEKYPGISLADERRRQAYILASFYSEKIGGFGIPADPEKYIASLPELSEEPGTCEGGSLYVPVIVENRVPWQEAVKLSGIHVSPYIDVSQVRGNVGLDEPKTPYVMWVSRYATTADRSLCTLRQLRARYDQKNKGEENVAGSLSAVISFSNVRRDLTTGHRLVVIGAEVDHDRTFVLSSFKDKDKPWLEVVHLDFKRQLGDVEFHHKRVVGSKHHTFDV